MQPTFIQFPQTRVIGLGARFISIQSPRRNNAVVIPQLWDRFISRLGEITGKTVDPLYGLVEMLPATETADKDELFYIACAPVLGDEPPPAGMMTRVIPAGRHALFTHKGRLDGLGRTMDFIYRSWLPASGLTLRHAPHLEVYDERFSPDSDKSEFDILLPVESLR